jgi:hypothetical protein
MSNLWNGKSQEREELLQEQRAHAAQTLDPARQNVEITDIILYLQIDKPLRERPTEHCDGPDAAK